jgi:isopropylmalate/homocitrate/citramalate synthase
LPDSLPRIGQSAAPFGVDGWRWVVLCGGFGARAVANVHASYEFGLRVFDSSVAGLGGCPYAKGATGNVATEDVVYLLHGLGADTGVDLDKLVDCGAWISSQLNRDNGSRVGRAVLAKRPEPPRQGSL